MNDKPHDIADLYLAPVALAIDARLAGLGELTDDELAMRVAIDSDESDATPVSRGDAVLRSLKHILDTHGWTLAWDPRGVRLSHGKHCLVLGVPANVDRYVDEQRVG